MEPIIVGEYHVGDSGWNVPNPNRGRPISNNTITGGDVELLESGVYSYLHTGPGAAHGVPCPSVHAFMTSVTMFGEHHQPHWWRGRIEIRWCHRKRPDNTISSDGFGTRIAHYDNNYGVKYGSIAFFSGNTWSGQTQVYNITESRVAVQSEFILTPPLRMSPIRSRCSGSVRNAPTSNGMSAGASDVGHASDGHATHSP